MPRDLLGVILSDKVGRFSHAAVNYLHNHIGRIVENRFDGCRDVVGEFEVKFLLWVQHNVSAFDGRVYVAFRPVASGTLGFHGVGGAGWRVGAVG
jgi:hypothetical protein